MRTSIPRKSPIGKDPAAMRITAGIANPEQYMMYTAAGADEVFCGYVPDTWTGAWGTSMPLNRREVRCCPVQLGSRSELRILAAMVRDTGKPAVLTFNAPCYRPEQLPLAVGVMEQCMEDGFRDFIVADPALMQQLLDRGLTRDMRLHISGEAGELNRYVLSLWREMGAARIIFHRKAGLRSMAELIARDSALHPDSPLEWEAFAMNELCHFTGAYCSSLHSDELAHLCHLPWRLGPVNDSGQPVSPAVSPKVNRTDVPGFSGCGLCALPALSRIGITHLKVVGRGAETEDMLRDITALRTALSLLSETSVTLPDNLWQQQMRRTCFPDGCGEVCYYRE